MTSQSIEQPASITAHQQNHGRHAALPKPVPATAHTSLQETQP